MPIQNLGRTEKSSSVLVDTTGLTGVLLVQIQHPGEGVILERTLPLTFTWTYGSVADFGVDGFIGNEIEVRSFGPGGQELPEGSNAKGFLSDFTGADGDTMFTANLNLPPSFEGQIDVVVPAGAATLTGDSSIAGPPDPVTLTIEYNTIRMVQSPGVSIILPRGRDRNIQFLWTESVPDFTADDIRLPPRSVVSLIAESFRQLDMDGRRYEIEAMLPSSSNGTTDITVPAFSAQGEHGRGPRTDVTETWTWDTRTQDRTLTGVTEVADILKELATLVDGGIVGILENIEHNGFIYLVIAVQPSRQSTPNNFPNFQEQCGAELWRITIATGAKRLIRSWNYVTTAARSLCIHDDAVHFFEGSHLAYQINDDIDTQIVYDGNLDRNVEQRTYAWKADVGQLRKIVGTGVERVGQSFRSAFVNPDENEAVRDKDYGIHGGTASPMISVDGKLLLVSGYDDLRNIHDIEHAVSDVFNWQLLSLQDTIEPRLPVLETNGLTGWALLEAISETLGAVIGFTPSGQFYFRPHGPDAAEIADATLTASATSATIQNANTLVLPSSGRCLIAEELCSYTRSGTTLTLTRTNGVEHTAGDRVLFIDHYLSITPNTLVMDIEDVVFSQALEWFYNKIIVEFGSNEVSVPNPDSISTYGESELRVKTLLSSQDDVWAEWLANQYLERFSEYREVVTLQMKYTKDVFETDVVYLNIPERAHMSQACEVVEVNHGITDDQSVLTLVTIP